MPKGHQYQGYKPPGHAHVNLPHQTARAKPIFRPISRAARLGYALRLAPLCSAGTAQVSPQCHTKEFQRDWSTDASSTHSEFGAPRTAPPRTPQAPARRGSFIPDLATRQVVRIDGAPAKTPTADLRFSGRLRQRVLGLMEPSDKADLSFVPHYTDFAHRSS